MIKSLYKYLKNSSEALRVILSSIAGCISSLCDTLSYIIIKIELKEVFDGLYTSYNISGQMEVIKSGFQKLEQALPLKIYSEVLKSSFVYFMESWKLSIIRTKPKTPLEQRISELKSDTKTISIFFESKQKNGSLLGISRHTQKEYLQNNFECISLCVNASQDLVNRFNITDSFQEKVAIAWILIARREEEYLEKIIIN